MESKFALYQKWPDRKVKVYNAAVSMGGTTSIAVFPADKEGLKKAIEVAERPDAKIVKLPHEFYVANDFQEYIEEQVAKKNFWFLFNPLKNIPGEI